MNDTNKKLTSIAVGSAAVIGGLIAIVLLSGCVKPAPPVGSTPPPNHVRRCDPLPDHDDICLAGSNSACVQVFATDSCLDDVVLWDAPENSDNIAFYEVRRIAYVPLASNFDEWTREDSELEYLESEPVFDSVPAGTTYYPLGCTEYQEEVCVRSSNVQEVSNWVCIDWEMTQNRFMEIDCVGFSCKQPVCL